MEYLLLLATLLWGTPISSSELQWDISTPSQLVGDSSQNQTTIHWKNQGELFELPIQGSTGFSVLNTTLKESNQNDSLDLASVSQGQSFQILQEEDNWWYVQLEDDSTGWLNPSFCMINLPDVLPSILYDNTNSVASIMQSFGKEIPSITGVQLYDTSGYNPRLEIETFAMPVLYSTAKKLAIAQESALKDGNTLILVEGYRPFHTQRQVVEGMTAFLNENPVEKETIEEWGLEFFIATGVSNHQKGIAVDVTLGKVLETEVETSGNYNYTKVTSYVEYEMPTNMHELSPHSASMAYPPTEENTGWERIPLSETMTEGSILLRQYCLSVGFSPLASEWWHFNDFSSFTHYANTGQYNLDPILSIPPI